MPFLLVKNCKSFGRLILIFVVDIIADNAFRYFSVLCSLHSINYILLAFFRFDTDSAALVLWRSFFPALRVATDFVSLECRAENSLSQVHLLAWNYHHHDPVVLIAFVFFFSLRSYSTIMNKFICRMEPN